MRQGSNKLYIENSDADSTQALIYGEFDNDKLTINGTLRVNDGTQQNGYIAVSDSNGTMTWTDPSTIAGTVAEVVDADNDTKIQVEENADEDIIRFDLAGEEKWIMTGSRMEPRNSGNSVFIGDEAGRDNVAGVSNVAIGRFAMRDNNSSLNVAVGSAAMQNSTSGHGTVAIGYNTMPESNGNYNVGIGVQAGYKLSTGQSNVFIGALNVGYDNVSGSDNIMIGDGSGESSTGSNRQCVYRASSRR
jgi:hypothetical protein